MGSGDPPGGAEPENPVPELALTGAKAGADGDHPMPSAQASAPATVDSSARWLAGGALALGAVAVGDGAGGATAIMNRLVAAVALDARARHCGARRGRCGFGPCRPVATDPVENTALAQGPQKVSATFNEKLQP